MSPHAVTYSSKNWCTTEALFQALRFSDDSIREVIRAEKSPMAAKWKAKAEKVKMNVEPGSPQDIINMRLVLHLKIEQHPDLKKALLDTGNATIIEDCTKRKPSIWGAQLQDGKWVGNNLLGQLWMELRESLRCASEKTDLG